MGILILYPALQTECAVCRCVQLRQMAEGPSAKELPTLDEILADPAASFWLKSAIRSALRRDPIDAANDAEMLTKLIDRWCREVLNEG